MTGVRSENLFNRYTRRVMHPLGELVHVAAIYLGIAVLVTLALGLTIPSVREQMRQVHEAMLVALQPDSLQDDVSGAEEAAQYDMLVQAADSQDTTTAVSQNGAATSARDSSLTGAAPGAPEAVETPKALEKSGTGPDGKPLPLYFVRELKASAKGLDIEGITSAQAQALRSYIARKYKIASSVAGVIIKTAFQVGRQKKLDPQLLLAVIAIESRYNPYAESHVGSQGLMQVMTRVHIEKFDRYGEGAAAALNPIANIRVGAQILDDCIKRRGSIKAGLSCYVGATGPNDGGYGARVLAEQRRIALASGIPIANK